MWSKYWKCTMSLLVVFLFSFFVADYVLAQSSALIDMRDVMHSRYKENEEKGNLKKFPE